MYFGVSITLGNIYEVNKNEAFNSYQGVVEAPNEEAFWEVAEKVEGDCARDTHIYDIALDFEWVFIFGDPIKFRGIPVKRIKMKCGDFLKIRITENVFFYSRVGRYSDICFGLQLTY